MGYGEIDSEKTSTTKDKLRSSFKNNPSENTIEKYKSNLSNILKDVFSLNTNPFPFDKHGKDGYKPKFKLFPSPTLKESNAEPYIKYNKPNPNFEFLNPKKQN